MEKTTSELIFCFLYMFKKNTSESKYFFCLHLWVQSLREAECPVVPLSSVFLTTRNLEIVSLGQTVSSAQQMVPEVDQYIRHGGKHTFRAEFYLNIIIIINNKQSQILPVGGDFVQNILQMQAISFSPIELKYSLVPCLLQISCAVTCPQRCTERERTQNRHTASEYFQSISFS